MNNDLIWIFIISQTDPDECITAGAVRECIRVNIMHAAAAIDRTSRSLNVTSLCVVISCLLRSQLICFKLHLFFFFASVPAAWMRCRLAVYRAHADWRAAVDIGAGALANALTSSAISTRSWRCVLLQRNFFGISDSLVRPTTVRHVKTWKATWPSTPRSMPSGPRERRGASTSGRHLNQRPYCWDSAFSKYYVI